ncbi:MAG: CBS domain-containing protein [Bryobacteraceae bacterium]|nr:CBS domain-containing protein [Bryobacterales bacterium]MEB2363349.1 CBS domain-containing protein [Bryobacterales bacterium]NUM99495.1 CBS domain-containing protein [Bryobacteraceae bacterium]
MVETVCSILRRKGGEAWTISPESTVYDALLMLADRDIGALLVVESGRLVGIISERDYARKVILKDKKSKDTTVHEIMATDLVTVTPDHTVDECMRIMTRHRIRHLPVLEKGKLAGLVSIGDLVNSIISAQAETINQLSNYIKGKYPA